jgi:hypothetical protein
MLNLLLILVVGALPKETTARSARGAAHVSTTLSAGQVRQRLPGKGVARSAAEPRYPVRAVAH